MNKRLQQIIRKLAEAKQATVLSDEELDYLGSLVTTERAKDDDAPRPLWSYVRYRALAIGNAFDLPSWDFDLNKILTQAGMATGGLSYEDNEQRWTIPVTRDALRRAVVWGLQQDDGSVHAHAASLVGYAGFDDLAGLLVDDLASGRGERASYGGQRVAASLQALALLGHPRAAELALGHVGADDYSIRNAARLSCLLRHEQLSASELTRVFDTDFETYDFEKVPDAFVAAAAKGALSRGRLAELVEGLHLSMSNCERLADLIVGARWEDSFAEYLAHDDQDLRAALALRVAWSDERWAIEPLRARLDEEEDDQPKMTLLAALGSFGEIDDAIEDALENGSEWAIAGAIWGGLGQARWSDRWSAHLSHEDPLVRQAAACAIALLHPEEPRPVELAYDAMLTRDDWWPWALSLRALVARDVTLPDVVEGFNHVSRMARSPADVDAAVAFFTERRSELMRWLGREGSDGQRMRAIRYAGLIGGEDMRAATEQVLIAATDVHGTQSCSRELLELGGPQHPVGKVKLALAMRQELESADFPACAVIASSGVFDIHARAVTALAQFGHAAEPHIAQLLFHADDDINRAATEAVTRMHGAEDAIIRDTSALLGGTVRVLADLETRDRLFSCPSKRVREALAEAAAHPDNADDDVVSLLLRLAVDREASVVTAATSSLVTRLPDAEWAKQLLLRTSRIDDWQMVRGSLTTMSQLGDPWFVPRLVEFLGSDDSTHQDLAVRGLERVAEKNPQLGLVVLDIREPWKLASRYGVTDQIDHSADNHTEALRLLMLALDRSRNDDRAATEKGRKVMLTPLSAETVLAPSEHGWDEAMFEQLALCLKVTFVDEDSGTVIAEVDTEPTGEVLSALLQTRAACATTIAWS